MFDVHSIYPRSLDIANTNSNPHISCSFLDLDIRLVDDHFVSKLYDKRRDFNFDILGLPSFTSNIPIRMTYGVLCSQFCRFAAACHLKDDFILNCRMFVDKLVQNGYPVHILRRFVNKFKYNKRLTLLKYREFDFTFAIFDS